MLKRIIQLIFITTLTIILSSNYNLKEQLNCNIIEEEIIIEEDFVDKLLLMSLAFCKEEELGSAVYLVSKKYNIPIEVIYALIATESGRSSTGEINIHNIMNINTNAVSNYNCIGVMQIHPKTALVEYNKANKTSYTKNDLYNVAINIEVGVWYYTQFKNVTEDWVELYVIYNVGYGSYNRINKNWFYGSDGKWHVSYKNKYFYMNDMYPPKDSKHGVYGKNKLPKYNAKKRFEICYKLCREYFNT